jgi:hypothetical protein
MPNRIQAAIDRMRARLAALPEAERRRLEETLKASWEELVAYQRLQSMAFACQKLTLEEAQTLYRIYGGEFPSPEKWEALPLEEKVVGTVVAAELARMRLCDVL